MISTPAEKLSVFLFFLYPRRVNRAHGSLPLDLLIQQQGSGVLCRRRQGILHGLKLIEALLCGVVEEEGKGACVVATPCYTATAFDAVLLPSG